MIFQVLFKNCSIFTKYWNPQNQMVISNNTSDDPFYLEILYLCVLIRSPIAFLQLIKKKKNPLPKIQFYFLNNK